MVLLERMEVVVYSSHSEPLRFTIFLQNSLFSQLKLNSPVSPSICSPFAHAGRPIFGAAARRPNYSLITPKPAPFQTLPSANLILADRDRPPLPLVLSLPFPIPERAAAQAAAFTCPTSPAP